jgi:tetratricopeptide (TPR) repeat protein
MVRGDGAVALPTLAAAWELLELQGPFSMVSDQLDGLLALELEPEPRAQALLLAGRVLAAGGRLLEASERLSDAARLAAQLGSARLGAEAHLRRSRVHAEMKESDRGEADANVALSLARTLDAPILAARAMAALGARLRRQHQTDEARALLEAAWELALAHGATRCQAEVARELGGLTRDPAWFARASRLAQDLGDRRAEGLTLREAAYAARRRGELVWEALLAQADRFAALGDASNELRALIDAGTDLCSIQQYERAESVLVRARQLATAIGAVWELDLLALRRGQAALGLGRYDDAQRHLEEAMAIARSPTRRAAALHQYVDLLCIRGDFERAEQAYADMIPPLEAIGNTMGAASMAIGAGMMAVRRGALQAARRWVDRGMELVERHGFREVAISGHFCRAEIAEREGDVERGLTELDAAVSAARELGPRILVSALLHAAEQALGLGDPGRTEPWLDEVERRIANGELPANYQAEGRRKLRSQLAEARGRPSTS